MTHVTRLERFELNGSIQHALVRGLVGAPILLLVQAGPGLPMIHEADALQARLNLEERWRVVYWDQRGTGRSAEPGSAPLDERTLSDDVVAIASALCERFGVEAVDVLGFSLGGTLALLAAGREGRTCIRRVVAVGPDIDLQAGELFAWRFAYEEALRRGHRRALRELRAIGAPPHDSSRRFMMRV
jgi:pimeloyl-ACP methyl ester carboxylesterase